MGVNMVCMLNTLIHQLWAQRTSFGYQRV
jgi:hypothetical protein